MPIPLTGKLQSIYNIELKIKLKGFIIYYNKKKYIISLHHGLPISEIYYKKTKLKILINCVWNELLIIEYDSIINNYTIKNFRIKLNNLDKNNYYLNDNILKFNSYEYVNINNLPTNPSNIYIKLSSPKKACNQGDSGSPIFIHSNILFGILSMSGDNNIYILPTYYIVKTLNKLDNDNIYSLDDNISKINKYFIRNNNIYHKSLKINIPLDTYLNLEGDINNEVLVNDRLINYSNISYNLLISNERRLIMNNNILTVNSTLLILIKMYYNQNIFDIFTFIMNNVNNNKNKIFLKILNKKDEIVDKSIIKNVKYNNKTYKFMIYAFN